MDTLHIEPITLTPLGTTKKVWANFMETCRKLGKAWKDVWKGIGYELGTTAYINDDNKLVIKGRYSEAQITKALQIYIRDNLTCQKCRLVTRGLNSKRKLCGPCFSTDGKVYTLIGKVKNEKGATFDLGKELGEYYDGWCVGPVDVEYWFMAVPKQIVELAETRAATQPHITLNVSPRTED